MSRLIICGRDGRPERTFVPVGDVVTIGRSSENHIQIDDLNSSRHHCEIHIKDQTFELVDKDSRNGVFVNGHRVSNRKTLAPGDKLEIGTTVLYYDHVPGEETPPEAGTPGKITVDINTGQSRLAQKIGKTHYSDDPIRGRSSAGR